MRDHFSGVFERGVPPHTSNTPKNSWGGVVCGGVVECSFLDPIGKCFLLGWSVNEYPAFISPPFRCTDESSLFQFPDNPCSSRITNAVLLLDKSGGQRFVNWKHFSHDSGNQCFVPILCIHIWGTLDYIPLFIIVRLILRLVSPSL